MVLRAADADREAASQLEGNSLCNVCLTEGRGKIIRTEFCLLSAWVFSSVHFWPYPESWRVTPAARYFANMFEVGGYPTKPLQQENLNPRHHDRYFE